MFNFKKFGNSYAFLIFLLIILNLFPFLCNHQKDLGLFFLMLKFLSNWNKFYLKEKSGGI